jgi:hypothetical protein
MVVIVPSRAIGDVGRERAELSGTDASVGLPEKKRTRAGCC